MYLNKLSLKEFGKFHNKDIELEKGVNVVYGDEQSGKTTAFRFIPGMLYDIDRDTSGGERKGLYESLKPNGGRDFSGRAYVKDDEKSYIIERCFLAGAKKLSVFDVKAGREVRMNVAGSVQGTLTDIDKSTYANDICISDISKLERQDVLNDISSTLTNLTETGTSNISKDKAIAFLEAEKVKNDIKPLSRRLDDIAKKLEAYEKVEDEYAEVTAKIKTLDEEFQMEAAKRKRVARKLVENEDGTITYVQDDEFVEKMDRLADVGQKHAEQSDKDEEEEKEIKFTDRIPVIFLTGLFVICFIAAIVYMIPFDDAVRKLFIIFTTLFVILTILDGFRAKGYFSRNGDDVPTEEEFQKIVEEFTEEKEVEEETEFDMTFAKEYKEKRALLKKEEAEVIERRSQRAKLSAEESAVFKKRSEQMAELKAIKLAMSCIEKSARDIKESFAEPLLKAASEMLSVLTDGTYTEIIFDEDKNVFVRRDERLTMINILTHESLCIIDMAIRLAACKVFLISDMPVAIDCAIDMFDEIQFRRFMRALSKLDTEQIILFTGREDVRSLFDNNNIQYKYQTL